MKTLYPALRQQLNANTLAITLKTATILAATIIIFYQDLAIIATDALQSEFMSHLLVIPVLFSYIIYRKRNMIRASIPFEPSPSHKKTFPYKEIAGVLLFLIAFLVYSYGSYTFAPLEFHMFTLPLFVTACILILFNLQTLRQLAFPILFLFFLTPPPTIIVYALGSTLSIISTEASCAILNVLGLGARISAAYGNPVITLTQPNGTPLYFAIDIACSGIYSLIGFIIFATFIAYIARTVTWKKPAILLIGLPLIYLLNILRITIIVILGYKRGMELAMTTFHLLGGWVLIFLGTLLLLILTEKTLNIQLFAKKETISCSHRNPLTEHKQNFCQACGRLIRDAQITLNNLDSAKIAALTISVILIISVQAPIFALTKGPADILTQLSMGETPTIEILPEVSNYTLAFIQRDEEFEQLAKQDASLTYAYFPTANPGSIVWVSIEIASIKSSLHPWEFCVMELWRELPLPDWQRRYTQLDLRDVELIDNPPLIARYFAFQYKDNNLTQVVLYWYETSTFTTNTTTQQKHVKLSLVAYPYETASIQETEDELLKFGIATANHWRPTKTWTEIALLISRNGNTLLLIPTTFLIILILVQIFLSLKTNHANQKAYQKLPQESQQILQTVKAANRHHKGTTQDIASTYQKLNDEPLTLDTLHETLNTLKDVGLIKQTITNHNDQPILTWKTTITLP